SSGQALYLGVSRPFARSQAPRRIMNRFLSPQLAHATAAQRDRVAFSPERRSVIVQRTVDLVAQLHTANGDSSTEGNTYRERIRLELRGLAISLWLDRPQFQSTPPA